MHARRDRPNKIPKILGSSEAQSKAGKKNVPAPDGALDVPHHRIFDNFDETGLENPIIGPKLGMKNAREMKAANRLNVLRMLRRDGLSRSELATATGLTRAAMSLIIGELIEEGLVLESESRESAAGRRPVPIMLQPEYAFSLGLRFTRAGAEAGVVDLRGRLLCRVPVEISGVTRQEAIRRMKIRLADLREKYSPPSRRWLGLGISTPGPVDVASGTILNPPNFEMWHDVCMVDEMKDLGIGNVFIENDSLALTIAEKTFGVGQEFKNFLLLDIVDGIGGGIVLNDMVYSGWRGFGHEIGHTSIDFNGPVCDCGLRGCLELYSSVPRVLEEAQKTDARVNNWQAFMNLAVAGDASCVSLLRLQARALATAIVNVINLLELDAVVLTGDVLYRGEMLRGEIERLLNEFAINRWLRHLPVFLSPLGERPGLMAAAGIPAERFFQGLAAPIRFESAAAKPRSLVDAK